MRALFAKSLFETGLASVSKFSEGLSDFFAMSDDFSAGEHVDDCAKTVGRLANLAEEFLVGNLGLFRQFERLQHLSVLLSADRTLPVLIDVSCKAVTVEAVSAEKMHTWQRKVFSAEFALAQFEDARLLQ